MGRVIWLSGSALFILAGDNSCDLYVTAGDHALKEPHPMQFLQADSPCPCQLHGHWKTLSGVGTGLGQSG